jgi:hypothetical protein
MAIEFKKTNNGGMTTYDAREEFRGNAIALRIVKVGSKWNLMRRRDDASRFETFVEGCPTKDDARELAERHFAINPDYSF